MISNVNDGDVEKKYKLGRTLGQGTFATVKLATCLSDRTKWAVKIIKRSALSPEDEKSLEMEIQILQLTKHPNIVSVKEVFYCKNYVYLVMDLMIGGELFDRIVNKDHYTEDEAKQALREICTAIKYCHDSNIVHRDLKPENILYASPEETAPLKLADFGLATLLKENQLMNVACGTPGYVAPEILRGQSYGKEVDIWSVGVILYILLCGFPPFYDDNNKKLFSMIVSANFSFPDPYWTEVSQEAKDLVSKLLVVDRTARLNADQILADPWLCTAAGNGAELSHFKPNMKQYNARRRFRSAIHAVQLTSMIKLKKFGGRKASLLDVVQSHTLTTAEIDASSSKSASDGEAAKTMNPDSSSTTVGGDATGGAEADEAAKSAAKAAATALGVAS